MKQSPALSSEQLSTISGGGALPLSGDVTQQINTNWGGTQIINEAPKPPTALYEYLRTNPAARLEQVRRQSTRLPR